MRIQHNIMAMNSYRNYANNTNAIAKNLEKLSSGYRINRAGDDAAGLAISEKMRAQITGLATAQKNAKDGISLIQTAEGALTEVHSMLNRMFELAEQSANGTYDNEVDRANLQKEFDALRSEIDRIADSSNFNGQKLLDGSLSSKGGVGGSSSFLTAAGFDKNVLSVDRGEYVAATATTFTIDGAALDQLTQELIDNGTIKAATELADDDAISKAVANYLGINESDYTWTITMNAYEGAIGAHADDVITFESKTLGSQNDDYAKIAAKSAKSGGSLVSAEMGTDAYYKTKLSIGEDASDLTLIGKTITINGNTYEFRGQGDKDAGTALVDADAGKKLENGNYAIILNAAKFTDTPATKGDQIAIAISLAVGTAEGMTAVTGYSTAAGTDQAADTVTISIGATGATNYLMFDQIKFGDAGTTKGGGLTLQIGDTSDSYNMLTVSVADMHCKALGIDAGSININEQGASQSAMDAIKNAINSVSSTRGDLGALQNRLDHTINNLSVMEENIQDAEANIRDTDVAKEMMAYTKNNILIQSAQAMLAQANQIPQGVLQLLG